MKNIRGYQFRLYPTDAQIAALSATVGVVRLVYNLALEQRQKFGSRRFGGARHGLGAKGLSGELSALRREVDWIGSVSQTAQNQALLDLDRAFANFFAGRSAYPTPRKKFINDSFRHAGREIQTDRLNGKWGQVKIPKIGWVRYRATRPLAGKICNATVSRSAGLWHISIACKVEIAEPVPANAAVGVDRGVAIPFALSDGTVVHLPASVARRARSIKRAQQAMARRRRGSKRYAQARRRYARLQGRQQRARVHVAHVASTDLARRFGMVAIEALNIRGMTASAAGTVDEPGTNVRQKAGLNRAILNVGWHRFETMLDYKLAAKGGTLIKVAPHYTSQNCSSCGERHADSRKSQALFVCEGCGATHNADINAARNILALALTAPG